MQESTSREERLREEVHEMRKRWQEAITSREAVASEMGVATAPLLRQISSLQDALRAKGEAWQVIESTLSERALRAESAAEIAEHKRLLQDEQQQAAKQQLGLTSARLQDTQAALSSMELACERAKRADVASQEAQADLDSRLNLETAQRKSFEASLRELEFRHKVDQQGKFMTLIYE